MKSHNCQVFSPKKMRLFAILIMVATTSVHAQTSFVLDGTTGSNAISGNYSTTNDLTLSLGFFADYLLIGGGGGGGYGEFGVANGGGGGAGEFINRSSQQFTQQNYSIFVGGGGAGGTKNVDAGRGANGSNSTAFGLSALGGGGGGGASANGKSGGSGGGGAYSNGAGGSRLAATGNGSSGGAGGVSGVNFNSGGGGGAGAAGSSASSNSKGGDGLQSSITGTSTYYAGGGAGVVLGSTLSGGLGGGGSSFGGNANGGAGTVNTGGGGGGGGVGNITNANGGNGGSGIVIVRYQGASLGNIGGTVTSGTGTAAGYTLHSFTSTGNGSFNLSGVDLNARLGATLTGNITGTGSLTYAGPGTLNLSGANSYTKDTIVSGGTLQIGNGVSLSNRIGNIASQGSASAVVNVNNGTWSNSSSLMIGSSGNGTLNLNGGSVHTNSSAYLGNNATDVGVVNVSSGTFSNSGMISIGQNGHGTLNLNGGTTSTLGGILGWSANSTGLANVNNATWTNNGSLTVGRSGNGTLNLNSGTISSSGGAIGSNTGANGVVNVTGGTWVSNDIVSIGFSGNGTLNISGGNVSNTFARIGMQPGGSGTATISGGTWTNNGSLSVGVFGNGTLNINGGTVSNIVGSIGGSSGMTGSVNMTSGTWNSTGSLTIGAFGNANLSFSGGNISTGASTTIASGGQSTAFANMSGGTWTNQGLFIVGSSGNGTLNLTGGTMSIGNGNGTMVLAQYPGSTSTLNIGNGTTAGTLQTGTISGGGGIAQVRFNHSGNYTLSSKLAGTLSLNKTGSGATILSGNNTYSGNTTIHSGTLEITTTGLLGGGNYSRAIANNGNFIHGSNSHQILSGTISGSGGLVKKGAGTLTLSGNNSFSGGVSIGNGTLSVSSANALSNSGTISFDGGTLQYSSANPTDYSSRFSNAAGQQYSIDSNGRSVVFASGLTSSGGSLAKLGNGTVTLTAANSYNGGTTILGGTLATSGYERLPDTGAITIGLVGRLHIGGNETIDSVLGAGSVNLQGHLITGISSSTYAGEFTGSGQLTKAGAGTFTLTGSSTHTGDTIVSNGTLVLDNPHALWSGGVVNLKSGTITVNQRTFIGALDQNGGTVNGTGELVATLTSTNSGSLDAVIADGPDFAAGILKRTYGTTTIGAANTFTGAINLQSGTLQLGAGGSFDSNSSLVTSAGATMNLNNKSQAFSRISGAGGTISLGTGNLTVNQSTESEFRGSITGSGGLTKSGSGNLTLTSSSTYLGATTVAAGQLTVDGSIASNATIQNGARLTGSGSVGGLIINSGGTVNPGNSPGELTVTGNALWQAGGNYNWESLAINTDETDQTAAGTAWDFMDISGTLTLGGLSIGNEFNLNLTSLSSITSAGDITDWDPAVGSTWLIARAAGGIYLDAGLVSAGTNYSSLFNINTTEWSGGLPAGGFQIVTLGNTTDLYLQAIGSAAVPEPGQVAASLVVLVSVGAYLALRRRKVSKCQLRVSV